MTTNTSSCNGSAKPMRAARLTRLSTASELWNTYLYPSPSTCPPQSASNDAAPASEFASTGYVCPFSQACFSPITQTHEPSLTTQTCPKTFPLSFMVAAE
jgi:hypothetical protein